MNQQDAEITSSQTIDSEGSFIFNSIRKMESNPITLNLQQVQSIEISTIESWSNLQETLFAQYNILCKNFDIKKDRLKKMTTLLYKYYQSQLRFKDLQRRQLTSDKRDSQAHIMKGKQSSILCTDPEQILDVALTYVQKMVIQCVENPILFAQVIHTAFQSNEIIQIGNAILEDFVYNIINFIFDPIVGTGFQSAVFVFLKELLKLEFANQKYQDFFERNSIAVRFLCGFFKRIECHQFLQEIMAKSIKLLSNLKVALEIDPKLIYKDLYEKQLQKEMKNLEPKKVKSTIRISVIDKLVGYISKDQTPQKVQEPSQQSFIVPEQQNQSKRQLLKQTFIEVESNESQTKQIQQMCDIIEPIIRESLPKNTSIDFQILNDTASMIIERRTAITVIVRKLITGLLQNQKKIPYIIRVLTQLIISVIKEINPNLTQKETNSLVSQLIISKWVLPEFTYTFMRNTTGQVLQAYAIANVSIISKYFQLIWRGDEEDPSISLLSIEKFLDGIVQVSSAQTEYFSRQSEKHVSSYLFSFSDLNLFVNALHKVKVYYEDEEKQKSFINLQGIANHLKEMYSNFLTDTIVYLGQQFKSNQIFMIVNKNSDLLNIQQIDSIFKFVDSSKVKGKPKDKQQEILFLLKTKQVIVQFLMSIERIKIMMKFRSDVQFTMDNLIQIYKNSFEEQGVSLKSFENISSQLYANYLISINQLIPSDYKLNNWSQYCSEITQEFQDRVQAADIQLKTFENLFIHLSSRIKSARALIKQASRLIKIDIIKRNVLHFYKTANLAIRLVAGEGRISVEKCIVDKPKPVEARDKNHFIVLLENNPVNQVHAEIIFSQMKDFVDIFHQMPYFTQAVMESRQDLVTPIRECFTTYLQLCIQLLGFEEFYKELTLVQPELFQIYQQIQQGCGKPFNEWEKKKIELGQKYQKTAIEYLERYLCQRIMNKQQKWLKSKETFSQLDKDFHEKCVLQQSKSMKEFDIQHFQLEKDILMELSDQLRRIDDYLIPIEKLDCVTKVLQQVNYLFDVSGEGMANEGAEKIKPVFEYIIIHAAPKKIFTSLRLIECLLMRDPQSLYSYIELSTTVDLLMK